MKKSFETSAYRSEHFTTVPFLSEINKRPILSIQSWVTARVQGLCYPDGLNLKKDAKNVALFQTISLHHFIRF